MVGPSLLVHYDNRTFTNASCKLIVTWVLNLRHLFYIMHTALVIDVSAVIILHMHACMTLHVLMQLSTMCLPVVGNVYISDSTPQMCGDGHNWCVQPTEGGKAIVNTSNIVVT